MYDNFYGTFDIFLYNYTVLMYYPRLPYESLPLKPVVILIQLTNDNLINERKKLLAELNIQLQVKN